MTDQHCTLTDTHTSHIWHDDTETHLCHGYDRQPDSDFDQYPILRIPRNINRIVIDHTDSPILIEIER